MTDIVLREIDPRLFERIRRIGEARGWDVPDTLLNVLMHGLEAFEGGATPVFADAEAHALEAAIAALEHVPDDPGFALIGRAAPIVEPADEPDQSIDTSFRLESPA
ncbi:hypothetical protein [Cognatiluteimonas profundi]|uniref:hypothetical protein n=1 Tax=Cognatiluteimonas profundi TaxID=2594501 RepID=UPI0018EF1245|nr:hypothetical protein [Lysobacter profundi]